MATNGHEDGGITAGESMFREDKDFRHFWDEVRERWDRHYADAPEPSLDDWMAEAEKQLDLYRVTAQRYLETRSRVGLDPLATQEVVVLSRLMRDANLRLGAVAFAIHTAAAF